MPSYFHPYCSSVPDVTRSIMLKPLTVFIYSDKSCTIKSRQTKRHLYSKNRIKYGRFWGGAQRTQAPFHLLFIKIKTQKCRKKFWDCPPPPPITRFALNDPSHLSTHSGLIINMRNAVVVLIPIIWNGEIFWMSNNEIKSYHYLN